MKFKMKTHQIKLLTALGLSATILFSACKKENQQETVAETPQQKFEKPAPKTNPFSLANINKARETLNKQNSTTRTTAQRTNDADRLYTYIKFDPNAVTGEILQKLEADTSIQIMDFPFANGELYNDEFALDEEKAKLLSDGSLYAVTKKNSITETTLKTNTSLNPVVLDELYLPEEEDTTLQFQAFREAGYTEEMLARIRICLFKRPTGFVRYWDTRFNRMEPVRGMQVWGLVFGIPLHTYTDANGYYRFPWRFSAGTIMGTKAKNNRVNIKPLDTHGTLIRNIYTLITQFIVGSIHIHGWVSSCQMRSDVNFEFSGHRQVRYWSQLLNAYHFHDQYCANDNVDNAPQSMTVYAQWANTKEHTDEDGLPDFGNASTPMLGHIPGTPASIFVQWLRGLFDGEDLTNYPNLFNLLTGLMPDMTFRVPQAAEPQFYNERLAQIAFHELAHAMHYRRAGNNYWIDYIKATLAANPVAGNPYGNGQNADDGNVAVGESWAEFLGTNHAIRRYGNDAQKNRTSLFFWNGNFLTQFQPNPFLQENERWFFGGNWIPSGFYNDLQDGFNPVENWDNIQGTTIRQLLLPLGPQTDFTCDYLWTLLQQNPALNQNDVITIAMQHDFNCF